MYDGGGGEESAQPAVRKHFTCINDIINGIRFPNIGNRNRNIRDRRMLQPHYQYMRKMTLPYHNVFNPADAICTHFLLHCYNKTKKSAVYSGHWAPDGRRLVLGTKLGELTLWEGETFKFERIVQHKPWMVHPIDTVAWSRNANFLLCGDETGNIIYFDKGMTWVHNVREMHTGPVRSLSFSPSETKFASCSDDRSVRIWDYRSGKPDKEYTDHLSDVKCCEWHPHRSLVASGSKDNAVKLFDPRCDKAVTTIHTHKNSVLCCGWNSSGNLLATGSRDNLVKVFDIRAFKEFAVLRGHENQVTSLSWHPLQEALLLSGGYNGNMMYWVMGHEGPHSSITGAHNYSVNAIMWHPLGHGVATAANDGVCKFWCREPPGSTLQEELEEWQEPSGVVIEHGPLPPPEAAPPVQQKPTDKQLDSAAERRVQVPKPPAPPPTQGFVQSSSHGSHGQMQNSHYQRQPPPPPPPQPFSPTRYLGTDGSQSNSPMVAPPVNIYSSRGAGYEPIVESKPRKRSRFS